jgi:hypothetical protein
MSCNEPAEPIKKKRGFFQTVRDFYWALQPIFWTHHPMCSYYKDHTIHLFNKDLCIGCFVGIPSGFLMLFIGSITGLFDMFNTKQLWSIGFVMISVYFLSIFGLTNSKKIKITTKIIIGSGAGFIVAAIFSYPDIFIIKLIVSIVVIGGLLSLINVIRLLKMNRTCKKCEYKRDLDHCPGFSKIIQQLAEKGFHSEPEKKNKANKLN